MRGDSLHFLVRLGINKSGSRLVGMLIGVGIGIAALCFIIALGLGIGQFIRQMMSAGMGENELIVEPSTVTLGPVKMDVAKMGPDQLQALAKIPGVAKVLPQMNIYVPCRVVGTIYGQGFTSDIAVVGLPLELIAADLPKGESFAIDEKDGMMPAILSPILLEAYNTGFAPVNNLPKLSETVIIGRPFTLYVGESSFVPAEDPALVQVLQSKVIGLSLKAPTTGCAIPISEAERLNKMLIPDFEPYYTKFYVYASDLREVETISTIIKDMGFEVRSMQALLRKTNAVVWTLTALVSLFAFTILAVAAINIANTCALLVLERRTEIGLMRAVGATRGNIKAIILIQMGLVGLAAGLFGLVLSLMAAGVMDGLGHRFLSQYQFLPKSFFAWSWWIPALAIGLAVCLSIIASLAAARKAADLDPAVILMQ